MMIPDPTSAASSLTKSPSLSADRIRATYWIETPLPLEDAAAFIAGEQSSGTFVAVPGETEELKARCAARVESVVPIETRTTASLPGCRHQGKPTSYQCGHVTLSWPVDNVGANLPTLVATLQGNLYELSQVSGLKLIDFDLPESIKGHFRGPRFGIDGTRTATGVSGRPLIGTIIKPSVGLSPEATAAQVNVLLQAGIDFIKDDELMANPPHSPFDHRCKAIMQVVRDHEQKAGRKIMYAFNISDEWDELQRHYDTIIEQGGSCAMMSIQSVGYVAAKKICDIGALVIHGHRNGFGMVHRHPSLGMDFVAYQKWGRLIGIDQLHVNGIANKFWEPDDSVVRSIEACLAFDRGQRICPVVSSGQWGGQAFETYRRTKTIDLLYLAGGGIMAHPSGPAGGVKALRDAWQMAVEGCTLEEAARRSPELAQSIVKFAK